MDPDKPRLNQMADSKFPPPGSSGESKKRAAAPKLGQWALNKNHLKKLGIESSVLSALTKMKATAVPAEPPRRDPVPSSIPLASTSSEPARTIGLPIASTSPPAGIVTELQRRINSNFQSKFVQRKPQVEIISNVIITNQTIDLKQIAESPSTLNVPSNDSKSIATIVVQSPAARESTRVKQLLNAKLNAKIKAKHLQASSADQVESGPSTAIRDEAKQQSVVEQCATNTAKKTDLATEELNLAKYFTKAAPLFPIRRRTKNNVENGATLVETSPSSSQITIRERTPNNSPNQKQKKNHSPDMYGFHEDDASHALQELSDYQSDIEQHESNAPAPKPPKRSPAKPRSPKVKPPEVPVNKNIILKPPIGFAKKAVVPELDSEEADDEISDVESKRQSSIEIPASIATEPIVLNRSRRVKIIPAAVLNRRPKSNGSPSKLETNIWSPSAMETASDEPTELNRSRRFKTIPVANLNRRPKTAALETNITSKAISTRSTRSLVHGLQMGANLVSSPIKSNSNTDTEPTYPNHKPHNKGLDRVNTISQGPPTTTDDDSEPNRTFRPVRSKRLVRNRSVPVPHPDKSDDMSESVVDYIVEGLEARCSSLLQSVDYYFTPVATQVTNTSDKSEANTIKVDGLPKSSTESIDKTSQMVESGGTEHANNINKENPTHGGLDKKGNNADVHIKEPSKSVVISKRKLKSVDSKLSTDIAKILKMKLKDSMFLPTAQLPPMAEPKAVDNVLTTDTPIIPSTCVHLPASVSTNVDSDSTKEQTIDNQEHIYATNTSQPSDDTQPTPEVSVNVTNNPNTIEIVSKKKLSTDERNELWKSLKSMMPGMPKILKKARNSLLSTTESVPTKEVEEPQHLPITDVGQTANSSPEAEPSNRVVDDHAKKVTDETAIKMPNPLDHTTNTIDINTTQSKPHLLNVDDPTKRGHLPDLPSYNVLLSLEEDRIDKDPEHDLDLAHSSRWSSVQSFGGEPVGESSRIDDNTDTVLDNTDNTLEMSDIRQVDDAQKTHEERIADNVTNTFEDEQEENIISQMDHKHKTAESSKVETENVSTVCIPLSDTLLDTIDNTLELADIRQVDVANEERIPDNITNTFEDEPEHKLISQTVHKQESADSSKVETDNISTNNLQAACIPLEIDTQHLQSSSLHIELNTDSNSKLSPDFLGFPDTIEPLSPIASTSPVQLSPNDCTTPTNTQRASKSPSSGKRRSTPQTSFVSLLIEQMERPKLEQSILEYSRGLFADVSEESSTETSGSNSSIENEGSAFNDCELSSTDSELIDSEIERENEGFLLCARLMQDEVEQNKMETSKEVHSENSIDCSPLTQTEQQAEEIHVQGMHITCADQNETDKQQEEHSDPSIFDSTKSKEVHCESSIECSPFKETDPQQSPVEDTHVQEMHMTCAEQNDTDKQQEEHSELSLFDSIKPTESQAAKISQSEYILARMTVSSPECVEHQANNEEDNEDPYIPSTRLRTRMSSDQFDSNAEYIEQEQSNECGNSENDSHEPKEQSETTQIAEEPSEVVHSSEHLTEASDENVTIIKDNATSKTQPDASICVSEDPISNHLVVEVSDPHTTEPKKKKSEKSVILSSKKRRRSISVDQLEPECKHSKPKSDKPKPKKHQTADAIKHSEETKPDTDCSNKNSEVTLKETPKATKKRGRKSKTTANTSAEENIESISPLLDKSTSKAGSVKHSDDSDNKSSKQTASSRKKSTKRSNNALPLKKRCARIESSPEPEISPRKRRNAKAILSSESDDDEYVPRSKRTRQIKTISLSPPKPAEPKRTRERQAKSEGAKSNRSKKVTDFFGPSTKRETIPAEPTIVTCGNCKVEVPRKKWQAHVISHYGSAWMEGIEAPLPMEPIMLVGNRMQNFLKRHKLKAFVCPKCRVEKKSGMGYLSHVEICGLSTMEREAMFYRCTFCPAKIRKVSLHSHNQICLGQNPDRLLKRTPKPEVPTSENEQEELNESGRTQRKCAKKAKRTLKQLTETEEVNPFEASDSDAYVGEESSDSDGSSGVPEGGSDSDQEDRSTVDQGSVKSYKRKKNKCLIVRVQNQNGPEQDMMDDYKLFLNMKVSPRRVFTHAIKMTQKFRAQNYTDSELYPFIHSITSITTDPLPYFPKLTQSPPFIETCVGLYEDEYGNRSINKWQQIGRFESVNESHSHVLYCGGPIRTLEWIPLPAHIEQQYLAVSCQNDHETISYISDLTPHKGVLQIWSTSSLNSTTGIISNEPMRLQYTLAMDKGPIMCLAFCPSGGYAPQAGRLAMAAIPTIAGDVQLVGLPLPSGNNGPPVGATLNLNPTLLLKGCVRSGQVTRIVWSKTKGHSLIVAGYTSGMVIVWNLNAVNNPIFERTVNGVRQLSFVNMVQACTSVITLLDLHHDHEFQDRWLVTGSTARRVKFYDLHRMPQEVSAQMMKSRCMGGSWPTNWPVFFSTIDESYFLGQSSMNAITPIGIGGRWSVMSTTHGTVMDMRFCDWMNVYLVVSDLGDVRIGYCSQLLSHFKEIHKRGRGVLSFTDYANTTADVTDSSSPSIDQTGVVFCEMVPPARSGRKMEFNKRRAHFDKLPSVRINRISINPNENAFRYYAIGYGTGFVRVCRIKPF